MNRVVISGIGIVSPIGLSFSEYTKNIFDKKSAITQRTFRSKGLPDVNLPIASVTDFDLAQHLPASKAASLDRVAQFAVYSARAALKNASLTPESVGAVIVGSSFSGMNTLENAFERLMRGNRRISPLTIPKAMTNAPASAISIDLNITAPSFTVATACSSSNQAIMLAAQKIASGELDTALAGGVEASLVYSCVSAWNQLGVLAKDTCRPFCAERSGLVLGEGGAMFTLERLESALARGATIYGEITGWGESSDATSMTTPSRKGISSTLRTCLQRSGLKPEDVDYINAHGTGTTLNDITESASIIETFGSYTDDLSISSTKSIHGHALSASGALELTAVLAAIDKQTVPPNLGYRRKDPKIGISCCANQPIQRPIDHALSSSFAFGGHNSVLSIARFNS